MKGVRPSRSLYYFLHFTQIQHQNQFDRADEFEADWVVELDRVGTNITPSRSRQTYSKRICLWDLAQSVCIVFIIQIVWAI